MKKISKISPHYFVYTLLFLVIVFSITRLVLGTAPIPGHNFTEASGGIATGQIIYGSAADTFSALSDVAAGSYLRSGGVSTAPVWSTPTLPNTATNLKVLIGNATNWVESTPAYPNASVTAGKVIVSDGTNYIASTPTFPNASATLGKTIRSDGTNWIASTATLSDAPSTAGKILVSDGTNWITSTPTFPNASAATRKKIVSDGTNWVASTETWAVPGTAGNILQSDGTNWTAAAIGYVAGGKSAVTTIAATTTDTTGGVTYAAPAIASGQVYRITARGTFTAVSSATARNAQVKVYWGTTALTPTLIKAVLVSTAQTTNWQAEFELVGTSTTVIWTTGSLDNQVASATIQTRVNATPASTTVTAGAQTLDLRFSMSAAVTSDSWAVQQVLMERLK